MADTCQTFRETALIGNSYHYQQLTWSVMPSSMNSDAEIGFMGCSSSALLWSCDEMGFPNQSQQLPQQGDNSCAQLFCRVFTLVSKQIPGSRKALYAALKILISSRVVRATRMDSRLFWSAPCASLSFAAFMVMSTCVDSRSAIPTCCMCRGK